MASFRAAGTVSRFGLAARYEIIRVEEPGIALLYEGI